MVIRSKEATISLLDPCHPQMGGAIPRACAASTAAFLARSNLLYLANFLFGYGLCVSDTFLRLLEDCLEILARHCVAHPMEGSSIAHGERGVAHCCVG